MSVQISAACKRIDITGAKRAVLLEFADHANDDGICWPSRSRVMYNTGLSESAVKQQMRELRDEGVLTIVDHHDGGRGRVPIYKVCPEKGLQKAPFKEWYEELKGANSDPQRGQILPERGHSVPPEPSRTIREPSNPTGGKTQNVLRTHSQKLTDDFYNRIKGRYNIVLEKEQYAFHLGHFRNMLKKYEPDEKEALRVIAYMVDKYPSAPKIRATKAIQDVRLKRDTGEAWSGPAPWEGKNEPINPQSDKAIQLRDRPNSVDWYCAVHEGVTPEQVKNLLTKHCTHSEMLKALERGVVGA